MAGEWIGAGLSALGSVGSASISSAGTKKAAKVIADFNKDQWYREIAYNDPSAQVARLKAAGLSPHLVYGQGVSGASGNSSVSSPDMPMYQYDIPNFIGEGIAAYQTLQGVKNDTDKTQQDIAASQTHQLYEIQETKNKAIEADNLLYQGDLLRQQFTNLQLDAANKALQNAFDQMRNANTQDERERASLRFQHEMEMWNYQVDAAKYDIQNRDLMEAAQRASIRQIESITNRNIFDLQTRQKEEERNDRRYYLGTDRATGAAAVATDLVDSLWRSTAEAIEERKQKRQQKRQKGGFR